VNADWFYTLGNERHGPVTEDELRRVAASGQLRPDDLVWKDGMPDWVEAGSVDLLFPRAVGRAEAGGPFDNLYDDPPRERRRRDDDYDRPRRRRDDQYEDDDRSRRRHDDDYDRYPGPRRDQKPGQVTAVAVMLLVGGILGLVTMFGVAVSSLFVCCLWPGILFEIVWAIMAIVRASNMLGRDDQGPPRGLAVMQIICVINGDFVNCVLGIVSLVLLNDPGVVSYYRRRGYA